MNGFLGTRGSLMLDLVTLGMLLIVPVLLLSIYLVRAKKRYTVHKRLQLMMASVLLAVLVGFEMEMRLVGWRQRAAASPMSQPGSWNDPVEWSLLVHLAFAIPTLALWVFVVVGALRGFPQPPGPAACSALHRRWGRRAALGMIATALSGIVFYYLAFVMV